MNEALYVSGKLPTYPSSKCDRAARVVEVANDNQRKTKCVQNKQEFNGQLEEKKYNKNTRKTNKATKRDQGKPTWCSASVELKSKTRNLGH